MAIGDVMHFNYPFSFDPQTGHVATADQDSLDDIASCVAVSLLVEPGVRSEIPNFGTPDQVFQLQPLNMEIFVQSVYKYEQRADVLMQQNIPEPLVDKLRAIVEIRKTQTVA